MPTSIPYERPSGPIGGRNSLEAKLWPNGEIAIWKPRTTKLRPLARKPNQKRVDARMAFFRLAIQCPEVLLTEGVCVGLSPHAIFDRLDSGFPVDAADVAETRAIKGLKGITSYGARMVRNSAHVLESLYGKARCVFATVTIPSLPLEDMRIIQESWHKVTELYRLNMRRMLQEKGLKGEMVTVSEIQEKRYQETGLPVLHLHSVFCGVTRTGKYAVSTEDHDYAWYRAMRTLIDIERSEVASACNLQRVKKSAAAYLGKYISKGVKDIEGVVAAGYGSWMPKHWWNCARTLVRRVKAETRPISYLADWLNSMADIPGNNVWVWHRDVVLEMSDGFLVTIARYGRLTKSQTAEVHMYHQLNG